MAGVGTRWAVRRGETIVATVIIEDGKATVESDLDDVRRELEDLLSKPHVVLRGESEDGTYRDRWVELQPGDEGHAEAVLLDHPGFVAERIDAAGAPR
jgi:hypothetical protein